MACRARRPADRARSALRLVLALCALGARDVAGAQPPAAAPPAPAAPAAAPAPPAAIAVPEISTRAEEVIARLKQTEASLVPSPQLDAAEHGVGELAALDVDRVADAEKTLEQGPQLRVADQLMRYWTQVRAELGERDAVLTGEAKRLEEVLADIAARRDVWLRTRNDARAANAPNPVLDRVDETLSTLGTTQKVVEKRRAQILEEQDKVTRSLASADEMLDRITKYRDRFVASTFVRDSQPVWGLDLSPRTRSHVVARIGEDLRMDGRDFRGFMTNRGPALVAHGAIFVVLCLLFRRARSRTRRMLEREPGLEQATRVFQVPYSAAFILTLLTMVWVNPDTPPVVPQVFALVGIVPVLRILRPYLEGGLGSGLYAFVGFFLTDRLRFFLSSSPVLEQIVFLVEMLAGLALMAWILRPRRLLGVELPPEDLRRFRFLGAVARVLFLALAAAFVAGALGYMQLGRLVGGGALRSVYAGMGLFAGVRAFDGLVAYALRSRAPRRLRMVEVHRESLERWIERGAVWVAWSLWGLLTLSSLELLRPVSATARAVLSANLAWGETNVFTLGDLLAFGVTIWAAVLLSRSIRFVLQEDVYPRLELSRGVPYALSSVIHYGILFGGFLLAITATGLDLNRFTVLAGAFGVGIGFGLQNVVNNFVSGLILLLERPIQVGDVVQIADVTGEVTRIGIRSCTLRTPQGAEVIVPNGNLISDRVTNWTFSDPMRRIEVAVSVAYGTDPEKMLALLVEVAQAHPNVASLPPPVALFQGFGDVALDFELRAWTNQPGGWVNVRSELAVAVYRRLNEETIEIPYPRTDIYVKSLPKT